MEKVIKFYCQHCGQRLSVDAEYALETTSCPICGNQVKIPLVNDNTIPDNTVNAAKKTANETVVKKRTTDGYLSRFIYDMYRSFLNWLILVIVILVLVLFVGFEYIIAGICSDLESKRIESRINAHRWQLERLEENGNEIEKNHNTDKGHLQRLKEINKERIDNVTEQEALRIIEFLTLKYGDLGLSIDFATGKIKNLIDAQLRMNEMQKAETLANLEEQAKRQEQVFRMTEKKLGLQASGNDNHLWKAMFFYGVVFLLAIIPVAVLVYKFFRALFEVLLGIYENTKHCK